MPDLLDSIREDMQRRLDELRPVYEEYNRISDAVVRLRVANGSDSAPAKKLKRLGGAIGRPKGTGTTQEAIVETLRATSRPLTPKEVAESIGLGAPNYLYKALPVLERQGLVVHVPGSSYPSLWRAS